MASRKGFHEELEERKVEYRKADRSGKSAMLDHWQHATRWDRKYLTRLFNAPEKRAPASGKGRTRRPRYSERAVRVLRVAIGIFGVSTERFKAMLPWLLPYAPGRVSGWTGQIGEELSAMSARQMSRRLKVLRERERRKRACTTRAPLLRRQLVPISVVRPQDAEPGLLENDTVSHGGDSAGGQFVRTVNSTDVCTGWTCAEPVMGNAALQVVPALARLVARMPFAVWEMHSDNGSEFINHHTHRWCGERGIAMTRGRPYRKNDNARIEQKNWTHVREIVGYKRYDSQAALEQMRRVYAAMEPLYNLFLPNSKLAAKKRVGGRLRRIYDNPKTPLDRLAEHFRAGGREVSPAVEELLALRERLNPFDLHDRLCGEIELLLQCERRRPDQPINAPKEETWPTKKSRARAAGVAPTGRSPVTWLNVRAGPPR